MFEWIWNCSVWFLKKRHLPRCCINEKNNAQQKRKTYYFTVISPIFYATYFMMSVDIYRMTSPSLKYGHWNLILEIFKTSWSVRFYDDLKKLENCMLDDKASLLATILILMAIKIQPCNLCRFFKTAPFIFAKNLSGKHTKSLDHKFHKIINEGMQEIQTQKDWSSHPFLFPFHEHFLQFDKKWFQQKKLKFQESCLLITHGNIITFDFINTVYLSEHNILIMKEKAKK